MAKSVSLTVQEAAVALSKRLRLSTLLTTRAVRSYCARGKLPGAFKFSNAWRIPTSTIEKHATKILDNAVKPARRR